VAWEGKLFAVIAFLEFVLIVTVNTLLVNEAFKRNLIEGEFYGVGLYFVISFFWYQSLRAINKESKCDLWISVALSLFTAMWLTNHLVNPKYYALTLLDNIGVALSVAAWFSSGLLAGVGYLAGKRFGYRAWNKVGGLSENQSVYEATANFRSTIRLDIFTVALCCYTSWFYVLKSSGLVASVLFFVWTLAKDLIMFYSINRGFTSYTRILRLTSFDILLALVATIVCDYLWYSMSHLEYLMVTYVGVGICVISTRLVVVIQANRALEEVAHNREHAELFTSVQEPLP